MPSLVVIGLVILEKEDFLKFRQCIFAIWLSFPLGKALGPSLNTLEFPLP